MSLTSKISSYTRSHQQWSGPKLSAQNYQLGPPRKGQGAIQSLDRCCEVSREDATILRVPARFIVGALRATGNFSEMLCGLNWLCNAGTPFSAFLKLGGMTILQTPPLILFSGLAADKNVFLPQKAAFPDLIVPAWPRPQRGETLREYCARMAEQLRTDAAAIRDTPPIIGGASFGGIVALHMAELLRSQAVVLIGSVRSPTELSRLAKLSRPLCPLVSLLPVRLLQALSWPLTTRFARRRASHLSGLARQFWRADPCVLRWSLQRILDWSAEPVVDCPVLQIHGNRDWVLPISNTQPDVVVQGGGHVISLTHANEVNDFILTAMKAAAGVSATDAIVQDELP